MANKIEVAVFGGGCFWCTEAVFQQLKGIISVMPGYSGGQAKDPTYEQICSGATGHAEVIKVEFNPDQVRFRNLLTVFFGTHDPTTPNRQGNDVGTQYRSIILYTNEEQRRQSEAFIKELNESSDKGAPIITEVKPLEQFYEAEKYHQQYFQKNPSNPYCQVIINPKLEKLQKEFSGLLKSNIGN